jgi:dTDP-4-dehydrorhamnose 3,5-epimerase-like enzyme
MSTIEDVKQFNLKTFIEPDGKLTPIELDRDLPFEVKRIFYVFDVHDQNDRGKHSHYKTKQILIALCGKVTVICDDGKERQKYILNNASEALYIPEMIWDEQIYYDKNSVLLVLSDTHYDPVDYIEDYEEFRSLKNGNN